MRAKRIAFPGLLVLWALAACDAGDVTAPHNLDPSFDTYTFGSYELVTGSNWDNMEISHTRVIGPAGGRLILGLHQLVVPEGVVARRTVFRMTKKLGSQVRVDLSATDAETGAVVDSFAEPVELWLSYRFAQISNADLRRVVVLWLKDNSESGEMVPVPTRIERRTRHVVGSLTHFSQYAMGLN